MREDEQTDGRRRLRTLLGVDTDFSLVRDTSLRRRARLNRVVAARCSRLYLGMNRAESFK